MGKAALSGVQSSGGIPDACLHTYEGISGSPFLCGSEFGSERGSIGVFTFAER